MTLGDEDEVPLQTVERGYVNVLRVRALLASLPLVIGALVLDRAVLDESRFEWGLPVLVLLAAVVVAAVSPVRTWRRLGYRLSPTLLQVVRGWLFHLDTIVPFVRVQHIDLTRGPWDKAFGTASLVVHTAGTHNSIVTLPGLSPERAAEIRDLIRSRIRSDLDER